jgi:hypothetical protein
MTKLFLLLVIGSFTLPAFAEHLKTGVKGTYCSCWSGGLMGKGCTGKRAEPTPVKVPSIRKTESQ